MSLEFRHIAHAYGQVQALEDISFAAPTGEITCLLGASGCGKSTLLGLAAGLLTVQQGSITLDDEVIADDRRSPPPEARPVGLVFQDGALFPHMTLTANVAFGLPKDQRGPMREEAESWGVGLGDAIAPFSEFTAMAHPDLFLAKAFDNRCGVGAAIQSMKLLAGESLPCTLIAAGSVQEEVGCRGAVTLGNLTRPDFALVMEGTPADDTHGMDLADSQGKIRGGVQIRVLDPTAIMNRRLVQFVADIARAEGIPHQIAVRKSGGTDARSLQISATGVPVVVLGVPARYIHSHNSLIDINDYLSAVKLAVAVVRKLDAAATAQFTAW